jgi:hypothetical protein
MALPRAGPERLRAPISTALLRRARVTPDCATGANHARLADELGACGATRRRSGA